VQSSSSRLRDRLASLDLPGTVWIGSRPFEPVHRIGTGIPLLDDLLEGGLPRGGLSEIVGTPSSGRTALVCALLASVTGRGEVAAVVDISDTLHPQSLQAGNVDLDRVLWVRPPALLAGLKCTELILSAASFGLVVLDIDVPACRRLPSYVWPRLARVARRTGTTLTTLSHRRLAGSFATLSLTMELERARWTRFPYRLFDGVVTRMVVTRDKFGVQGRGLRLELSDEDCLPERS